MSAGLAATALLSISMWAFVAGWLGLFLRHFDRPRPLVRYFADASYWMYLVHLPVVIWTAGLLAELAVPALVKIAVVLAVTTVVTAATYDWCVRSTALGVLLNGRRSPRGLPHLAPPAAPRSITMNADGDVPQFRISPFAAAHPAPVDAGARGRRPRLLRDGGWQVSVGISQGWIAAAVNAAVFTYAGTPGVRRAYRMGEQSRPRRQSVRIRARSPRRRT